MKSNFIISLFVIFVLLAVKPAFSQGAVQKAVIGNAQKITNNVLSVMDQNDKKIVDITVDTQTNIFDSSGGEIAFRDITSSDFVAVIATASGAVATGSAQPKRALSIYVKDASSSASLQLVTGIVTGINNGVVTIRTVKDATLFYNLTSSASATLQNGLAMGQNIVVIGTPDADGTFAVKAFTQLPY